MVLVLSEVKSTGVENEWDMSDDEGPGSVKANSRNLAHKTRGRVVSLVM